MTQPGALLALDAAGQERWRRTVQGPADDGTPPFAAGDVSIFAVGGAIMALDAVDGLPRWDVPVRGPVYGLWRHGDEVVALDAQVSDSAALIAIALADGAIHWRHDLPARGLLGSAVPTGDGGLAYSLAYDDQRTQVVDLRTGRVRWTSASTGHGTSPTAVGGLVLRGEGSGVTAYDAATGARRWRSKGLADKLIIDVVDDLAVVSQGVIGSGYDGCVVALRLVDGGVAWRAQQSEALQVKGSGPAGVVLESDDGHSLVGADGRTRWTAPVRLGRAGLDGRAAVVTAHAVVGVELGSWAAPTSELVSRDAATGAVRWHVAFTDQMQPTSPPLLLGSDRLLVLLDRRALVLDLRSGSLVRQVDLPRHVNRYATGTSGALLQALEPRSYVLV